MIIVWIILGVVVFASLTGVAVFSPKLSNKSGLPLLKKKSGIALLVPFRSDSGIRDEVWAWLQEYWKYQLPDANVYVGTDFSVPFCKTAAVNQAYRLTDEDDVIVIMDADCYLPGEIILDCAKRIRQARRRGKKMWFVPYRHFYRLTEKASRLVLQSHPANPYRFSSPPPAGDTEETSGESYGHWYGALIQIMPREAFIAAGGMDERFAGWGGEDVSFMIAVDTLYTKHRTTRNQVLHLWHPFAGKSWDERTWLGQVEAGTNNPLAIKYAGARARPERMRALTSEPGHHQQAAA